LALTVDSFGERLSYEPTDPNWTKWKPSDEARLTRLIAGYISHDAAAGKDRAVREFIGEFRGISASAKQKNILDAVGLARMHLSEIAVDGRSVDAEAVAKLLAAMQEASNPVKPQHLGIIDEEHLRKRLSELPGFEPESFQYRKVVDVDVDGIPSIAEVAFAWVPGSSRRMLAGVNWSPAIGDPFRSLVGYSMTSLGSVLAQQRCGMHEPAVIAVHLARARVVYTDAGKSALTVPTDLADSIIMAVESATKKWCRQRKAEERHKAAEANRRAAMTVRRRHVSIKDAAWMVMEEAYLKAAGNAKMANARQIMYAAWPSVQRLSDKEIGSGFDHYFTQTLLPDFMAAHPKKCKDWDVLYDKRGNFTEPHDGENVPLGTLEVRRYLARVSTAGLDRAAGNKPDIDLNIASANYPVVGPNDRYGAVLFIEKEGFDPILKGAKIDNRYDLAITSTKGMSVTAFRTLVEELSAMGITTFLLTDFDRSGIINASTLQRDTRRFAFKGKPNVIHLGLRLGDVAGLETETVVLDGGPDAIARNLKLNGATEDEIKFLIGERKRVELNAMTSDQFIAFVESKLEVHRVKKVIPDDAILADAYRRFYRMATVQAAIDEAVAKLDTQEVPPVDVPADLRERIAADLEKYRELPWDWALSTIVKGDRRGGAA
jgi:hypothetical protein